MSKRKARRGASASEPQVLVDINTTPLIDVMLVLLIMLIITIPIQLHAVNLNMPVGTPPTPQAQPEVVKIDIDERSVVHWQGVAMATPDQLEALIKQEAAKAQQPEVHLRPDRRAKYEVVASVLASVQRLGLGKIGVVGSEQFVQ
jgi:biopolymer transport protein ExbD